MSETVALWILVWQGFFILYFEYGVWDIKYTEAKRRTKWREDKRAAVLKKLEGTTDGTPKEVANDRG
jgi:hypothetical protein